MRRRIIHDNMGICPAKTKAVDADATESWKWPFHEPSGNFDLPIGKVDIRVWGLKVDVGWDFAALQHQDPLDQTCHASGSFEMADIWLERAHDDGVVDVANRSKRLRDGLELSPIARLGAGAVAFHVRRLVEAKA